MPCSHSGGCGDNERELTDEQAVRGGKEKGDGGRDRMTGGKDGIQPLLLRSVVIG